jgi:hypothetical protein
MYLSSRPILIEMREITATRAIIKIIIRGYDNNKLYISLHVLFSAPPNSGGAPAPGYWQKLTSFIFFEKGTKFKIFFEI